MSQDYIKLSDAITKSAELEEIFTSIAHQWRQPLSEINSIVSSIDNRLYALKIEDELLLEELAKIEAVTKNMSASIDDFRNYFQQQNEHSSSLESIMKSVSKTLFYSLKENSIALDISVEDSLKFYGNRELLKQIIITLVDNARDVLVARNIYNPKISMHAFLENGALFIKICDNGGGMSKSVMEQVFDPAFTTKHHSEGTGLGLFMAKKLAEEKLQASLYVKNVDSGVCFTIEFFKDGMQNEC